MSQNLWWKATTVYQIYPRSFYDSNNDGVGDINGIIAKLDYVHDLGIETIWISPFFSSPQMDFGYDISDYYNIAPEYGNLNNVENLISEIHERGMKVIFDLVLNHTSDQHPWFIESRSSRENPKRNWYIWRDGKKPNGKAPPNNWKSMTSGSGWHYDKTTDQWYWAAFLPFQPDLNYRNPEVKKEMFNIIKFWLDKGVDGFRLDIIGSIYEDAKFRDNPRNFKFLPSNDERGMLFRSAEMTLNHRDNYQFVKELRQILDTYNPPRFLVGEVFGRNEQKKKYLGGNAADGLHSVFLFETLESKFSKNKFERLIKNFEETYSEPLVPTWVFSNHDRFRSIHKLNGDLAKAKLQMAIQLTVRGIPFIYYGEELGMTQADIDIKKAKDSLIDKFRKYPRFIVNLLMNLTDGAINRDGCRTPMQWDDTINAGFTTNEKPWLEVQGNYKEINVKQLKEQPDSIYSAYCKFLNYRKNSEILKYGTIKLIESENTYILAYIREYSNEKLLIIANFSNRKQKYYFNTHKIKQIELSINELSNEFNLCEINPYDLFICKIV